MEITGKSSGCVLGKGNVGRDICEGHSCLFTSRWPDNKESCQLFADSTF